MISGPFQIALAYTLQNEGTAYVADKNDHATCSRYGITRATLSAWRGKPCTCDDVAKLTVDLIAPIYKTSYWDAMRLDQVGSQATATALFDMGVLNGPHESARLMQQCLGVVTDGIIGPVTIAAINKQTASFVVPLFAQMAELKFLAIVRRDATQAKFLNGWLARANRIFLLGI